MTGEFTGARVAIVTAFPDLIRSYLSSGVLGRGIASGKLEVEVTDIRDFASGDYRRIDDYCYGGGGMVLMAEPLERAVDSLASREGRFVVYPSPQGYALTQELVEDLRRRAALKRLIIVCGRYEGVDERFVERSVDMEISVGDFVLTGGELPALAITDAVARLVDGVVGRKSSVEHDSFFSGMLDNPHYTRPEIWNGKAVPGELLNGDHSAIASRRRNEAASRTISRRPDLLARAGIMPYLEHGAYVALLHHSALDRNGDPTVTSVTGTDLHDIARACRTYGVRRFIVVTPLPGQRDMVKKIASHWISGYGAEFNPDRASAMKGIKTSDSLGSALKWVEEREKATPFSVATTAKPRDDSSHWLTLKIKALTEKRPLVLVFGTGHGLSEDVIKSLDAVLYPITGGEDYNHLSVRSAASIALDRFFGFR